MGTKPPKRKPMPIPGEIYVGPADFTDIDFSTIVRECGNCRYQDGDGRKCIEYIDTLGEKKNWRAR